VKSVCAVAFPDHAGRKVQIKYGVTSINMSSYWDGGSKSTFAVIRLSDNKPCRVPTNHPVFDRVTGVDNFLIPDGFVVVEHIIFCGNDLGLRIHVPGPAPLLEAANSEPELSRVQLMVLSWIVGRNSAGRKYEIENNKFPVQLWDRIVTELSNMGYCTINKAGAVSKTLKAENYFGTRGICASQNNDGYLWRQCWDYETGKFGGWAEESLRHYYDNTVVVR
jgi:hypothetical protein